MSDISYFSILGLVLETISSIVAFIVKIMLDGLVKSSIYVVVGLTLQFAVPYVLPYRRARHYAAHRAFSRVHLFGHKDFLLNHHQF